MSDSKTLADRIEDLLPQIQCTKCGYSDCRSYAEAIATSTANYNQCPPGGAEGVARLAHLVGKPIIPLNANNGIERPRSRAIIDESQCIGCTLCIQACPVDAIVGAPKQVHTVLADLCTGCDLCVTPCPVDCITTVPVTSVATGWASWSQKQANAARERHEQHLGRIAREREAVKVRAIARRVENITQVIIHKPQQTIDMDIGESAVMLLKQHVTQVADTDGIVSTANTKDTEIKKRAIIQAALERVRKKKAELPIKQPSLYNIENISNHVNKTQINES